MKVLSKNGHPLLYLPAHEGAARETLRLYPAQSWKARLLKAGVDAALRMGLPLPLEQADPPAFDLQHVNWSGGIPNVHSEIVIANTGVFAGNPHVEGRRYLFLLCDRQGKGLCLAKVGFDAKAIRLIEAENEFLKGNAARLGLPPVLGEYERGDAGGFLIPFYRGSHPSNERVGSKMSELLGSWMVEGGALTLGEIPAWRRIRDLLPEMNLDGEKVRRVIGHGDFVPWNVLVDADGRWEVIDWERGESSWVPGWDWFHFVIQPLILVKRVPGRQVIDTVAALFRSEAFLSYARQTGIEKIAWELFKAYLLYFKEIIRPTEGRETLRQLIEMTQGKEDGKQISETMHPSITDVVAVMQTPPPAHGQAIMNQYLLEGSYRQIRLHHVRMAFSEEIAEVGGFRWKKVTHLLSVLFRIIAARLRTKSPVLYYSPASPNMVPFLRDCVILIATRWMFPRTVFHFHANGISEFYGKLPAALKLFYRLAYSRPDLSICLTHYATDDARHFRSRRIEVIANGIPDQAGKGPMGDGRWKIEDGEKAFDSRHSINDSTLPKILFLSTVSQEKGAGILLEALSVLKKRNLNFRCVMAGQFASKEEESTLRGLSNSLGVDDVMEWKGPVHGEAKWACYNEADVFCFPSHYSTEGLPVVLLEAMMFSLPVVASSWRGIPDIVSDGRSGYLVPTRDANAVADRLMMLLGDPLLRKRMGLAARGSYEERFTVEHFRKMMEDTLVSVATPSAERSGLREIVMVAQTPPPGHGQAIMNQYLLEGKYRKIRLLHVRMDFSEEMGEVGEFRWRKIPYLIGIIFRILIARMQSHNPVLYYPPASPNMLPFLRDCVLLICTRWMFSKKVFHFHAAGISGLYNRLPAPLKLLYRMAYSSPDLSICITRYATDDARHFGSKRIEIVPNGIPDESGYAVERKGSKPPKILFLSTVSKEKGVGILLTALITLRDRGIAFRCKIVGRSINKRENEEIHSTIRDQGLSEVVVWQEELQTSQKTEVYSNADIFCFPTHYHAESFGLVSVEAMMFGLPVVATAWRGLSEIVVEGETGFLVPVKAPALLADRLQELIEHPEMRRRMGEAGRRRFLENYTVEKFRDRMEEVLASV